MRLNILITNYLAKCLEISVMVWAYSSGIPLYRIPLLLAFFHSGYLVSNNIAFMNWNKPLVTILLLIGVTSLLYGFYSANLYILSVGIVVSASFIIQLKDNIKKNNPVSITSKFLSKSAGMASAILIAVLMFNAYRLVLLCLLLIVPLVFVFIQFYVNNERVTVIREDSKPDFSNPLNWIQFFHHVHYFLYCYTFWILTKNIPVDFFSVLFIVGWIAYYFMEKKYAKTSKSFELATVGHGHLFSGAAVLAMLIFNSNLSLLFLWFITGFGGGTIYMLRHCKEKKQFSLFEDWGHVIGCLISGIVVYLTHSVHVSIILSFIVTLIVAAISFLDNRKIHS